MFYRQPIDTLDADGFLVSRQLRPVNHRRLSMVAARIRQHGGPELSAFSVRILSIRLLWAAGRHDDTRESISHRSAVAAVHDTENRLTALKPHLFADLRIDAVPDVPDGGG